MADMKGGTPFPTDSNFELSGQKFHVLQNERGALAFAVQRITDQDVEAAAPYSIPVPDFSRGSGFSFEGPEGTYDEADGWDLSTPGKAVTWPLLASGQEIESTDARGWQFFDGGYLYVARGRYVCKYEPDDTPGSEWPIIEIHDLGDGIVIGGRPAHFKGLTYVPRRSGAFGAAQRFHELTAIATHVVESQTVTITGTPTSGSYILHFDGKSTGNIAYDAVAADVQAALRLVPGLELVTVSSSGTVPNFVHTVVMTGVAGAMGAASAPAMTNTDNTSGGTHNIANATTVAGTTDTWTLGPANEESVAFKVWRDRLVRADTNVVAMVSANPMTEADWGTEYTVGDSGQSITDLALYGRMLLVGKTDGLYSFDEETNVTNELPDLQAVTDESNCLGMEAAQGYLLIPHKTGLLRWRPGAWEYVGAEAEGGLEGALSGGWGRVQSIAPFGRYTFLTTINALEPSSTVMSLNPTGGRQTQALTPHMHHEEADAYLESSIILSRTVEPASPHSPSVAVDDNSTGTIEWDGLENVVATDEEYVAADGAGTTHYLKVTGFGNNVPDSATITGIKATVRKRAEPAVLVCNAESADGYVHSTSATYSSARSGTGLSAVTGVGAGLYVGQIKPSSDYFLYESFVSFDTSAVPDTAEIASATLAPVVDATTVDPFTVLAAVYDWSTSVTTADWRNGTALEGLTPVAELPSSEAIEDEPAPFTEIGTALRDAVNVTGDTRLILYSENQANNVANTGSERLRFYDAETSDPATLTVEYHEITDATVKLVKAGVVVGDNKADTVTKWAAADLDVDYGGSDDTWGTTWTPAEVNASDFGVVISALIASGEAFIDHIQITVFFSLPAQIDTQSFLSVLNVDEDRATFRPQVYSLPRAGLTIANDPNLSRARDDARLRTSRIYRPSRTVEKSYVAWEFYAEFSPQVNTPGLQVWGIVDDGAPVQLLDSDGLPALLRESGHHRVFFPVETTGRWCAIEYIIPEKEEGEQHVAVTLREGRLIASLAPRERNRILATLVMGPGEFPDLTSMRRTVKAQRDALNAMVGQVVEYKSPLSESGYATVVSVSYEEAVTKATERWTTLAKVELREELYA